jgi:hypothetical protein
VGAASNAETWSGGEGKDSPYLGFMRRARGRLTVFTFKDGLLARAAHDLQLELDDLQLTLDGEAVRGEFPLRALRCIGPVEGGVVRPERYDAGRRADVERAMNEEILHTERHPAALFTGRATPRGEGFAVEGTLALAGGNAPLAFEVRREGGAYRASLELQPSRWGIPQYRAMLGAIRLQDRVRRALPPPPVSVAG